MKKRWYDMEKDCQTCQYRNVQGVCTNASSKYNRLWVKNEVCDEWDHYGYQLESNVRKFLRDNNCYY